MKTVVCGPYLGICMHLENSSLCLVIATTPFSMGTDIPDIREVIHWSPPNDQEQYEQEIGRDGKDSLAVLTYDKASRYNKQGMRL